ncbi:MAG: oligosaccharide flippase family protein, partial [Polyangiales bacterium]
MEPEPPPSTPAVPVGGTALARRARLGVVALVSGNVMQQLTVLVGNVYLYRLLKLEHFGAFAIVQFALSFFALFGDAGLGAALIQREREPTQRELSSVWMVQLLLSAAIVSTVWIGAPYIVRFWPDMPESGVWLFRALSIDFMLTAMRVVPVIQMERHLQFGRLSALEVGLSMGFFVTAVAFAWQGFGLMSLVFAVLVQGTVGLVGAYAMRPWRPSVVLDVDALRPLMRFGLSYQAKNVFGFLTNAVLPIYGGRVLGQRRVGLINWAQTTAYFPLQFVQIISRIGFPLYSRLQSDKKAFAETLERAVQATAAVTHVCVGIFLGLGPSIIAVVFTDKWMPALPLLYIYSVGISVGFLTPVVMTALDATGRAGTTLRIAAFTALAIWVSVPIAAHYRQEIGFAIAYVAMMIASNALVVVIVRSIVPGARLWPRVRASILSSVVIAAAGRYVLSPHVHGPVTLVAAVIAVIVLFAGVVYVIDRQGVRDALAFVRTKKQPA